jgi:hypothetical protein
MEEKELDEYSYRAKQKIRRYWIQKEKKKGLVRLVNTLILNINQTFKIVRVSLTPSYSIEASDQPPFL